MVTLSYTTDSDFNILTLEVSTAGPHPSGIGDLPAWIAFPGCADLVPALGIS
jgi:hypothetical protein